MRGHHDQYDLFGGRAARDQALDQVRQNSGEWFGRALVIIAGLRGWSGTAEDIRMIVTPMIGRPHHHNVWGSLTSQAVKRELIFDTGASAPMKLKKSKARRTPVYVSRGRTA